MCFEDYFVIWSSIATVSYTHLVIVTEINPVKAIEARMDGYSVMKMEDAAPLGDIFVTATGCAWTITVDHMLKMKNGAILANAGHFNVEIDMAGLEKACVAKKELRENIMGYQLANGKWVDAVSYTHLMPWAVCPTISSHPGMFSICRTRNS